MTLLLLSYAQQGWTQASRQGDDPGLPSIPGASPLLNRHYEHADFEHWLGVFERPGREVFDQRFRIVHALGIHPGMRIADIGAGTGLFTVLLARATGPEGLVYAVDTSPSFVAGIEARADEYRVSNVVPLVNDQSSTGLEPRSIDLAFLCDTYHHFEDPAAMLRSIRQALVPYGQLVIIDFRREPGVNPRWVTRHVRANQEQVLQEVLSAGFRLLDAPGFLKESFFLRFQRDERESGLGDGAGSEDASTPQ